jgi:hypothetical protein
MDGGLDVCAGGGETGNSNSEMRGFFPFGSAQGQNDKKN